jgi:hypothetical protein
MENRFLTSQGGAAMSMFENDQYRWRETYFVLFSSGRAPSLKKLKEVLQGLNDRFVLTNVQTDSAGRLESITVLAPDDFAALDLCYVEGDEVREQVALLYDELKPSVAQEADRQRLERLKRLDARFDVLHFEQLAEVGEGEELDEMLDPSALLMVLDTLVELTDGIAVDPQAGAML